jgi:hypothetical protein
VASGAKGCVGPPLEDAGADADAYPENCLAQVQSARADQCGSETFICQRTNATFKWEPIGL